MTLPMAMMMMMMAMHCNDSHSHPRHQRSSRLAFHADFFFLQKGFDRLCVFPILLHFDC